MWQQSPKLLHSATTAHHLHPPTPPTQTQNLPSPPPTIVKQQQCLKLSRRELAVSAKSSLLLLLGSQIQDPFLFSKFAKAEEEAEQANPVTDNATTTTTTTTDDAEENLSTTTNQIAKEDEEEVKTINNNTATDTNADENLSTATNTTTDGCTDKIMTKRAFLDVSIDGEPVGRIVIGLYGQNVPAGAARFSDLVSGAAGISYRKKEFIKITPDYVQHGGLRSFGVDAELAAKTGRSLAVDSLMEELEMENEKCKGTKNLAGSVGIIVTDLAKPPPKMKLVARRGKLEIDEEEVGKQPNGTEFVIAVKDSPELDKAALVVGRVLEGMEAVERIGRLRLYKRILVLLISGWPS